MISNSISRAAKAAHVTVETVRFYERRGLILQPRKPLGGGAREYDDDTIARIRFVRQAQEIGFSLSEIAELLSLRADPSADCSDVRSRAIEKRDEVQEKLNRLFHMRDALDELIESCPSAGDVKACTIIEAMERGTKNMVPVLTAPRQESQEMKTTILNIDGMHCDGCAGTVEALLGCVPGVRKADVSFKDRNARVLHDPQAASEADLAAAIKKGGFTAQAKL